jgi:hypothetical protein
MELYFLLLSALIFFVGGFHLFASEKSKQKGLLITQQIPNILSKREQQLLHETQQKHLWDPCNLVHNQDDSVEKIVHVFHALEIDIPEDTNK